MGKRSQPRPHGMFSPRLDGPGGAGCPPVLYPYSWSPQHTLATLPDERPLVSLTLITLLSSNPGCMLYNMFNLISALDPAFNWLFDRATLRQTMARAPGTRANHLAAVRDLAAFARRFGMDPARMTEMGACHWIEFLAAHGAHPGTIRHKISHAWVYARLAGGTLEGLTHHRVGLALDAVTRQKDRPSRTKGPVPIQLLKGAMVSMSHLDDAIPLRAAFLLMYFATLRQSEVAAPSVTKFDPTRHLTCGDVSVGEILQINLKWAKNLQRYNQSKTLRLYPTCEPDSCPVKVVHAMLEAHPAPMPGAPLLVFKKTGLPMTSAYLRSVWATALKSQGSSHVLYGLHSIRKASATQAVHGGCNELEVQAHGGWKSNAHRVYIYNKHSKKVQMALKDSLK